jgi:hypothetical protein
VNSQIAQYSVDLRHTTCDGLDKSITELEGLFYKPDSDNALMFQLAGGIFK